MYGQTQFHNACKKGQQQRRKNLKFGSSFLASILFKKVDRIRNVPGGNVDHQGFGTAPCGALVFFLLDVDQLSALAWYTQAHATSEV